MISGTDVSVLFTYSTYKMVQFLTKWNVTTYQYLLTFRGQFSYSQLYGIEPMGVCHADDLIYLFDPVFGKGELKLNRTEVALREVMTSAWPNFAKFGDPTPPGKNCQKLSNERTFREIDFCLPFFLHVGSNLSWLPFGSSNEFWNLKSPSPIMDYQSNIQNRMNFWASLLKSC